MKYLAGLIYDFCKILKMSVTDVNNKFDGALSTAEVFGTDFEWWIEKDTEDVAFFKLHPENLPGVTEENDKKPPSSIASLWAAIRNRDIPNTKHEC
jgi:hypothetical protein